VGTEEKTLLPEPYFSQLNAAHYKLLLAEAKVALAERNFVDSRREHQALMQARATLIASVGVSVGRTIKTWDTASGEVEYEPVPDLPEIAAVKPRDPESTLAF
jgi:hypothetical protein